MRVLFTNAGRRNYLLEFVLAPESSDSSIKVFVSDCNPWVPTFHTDERVQTILLPPVLKSPDHYLEALWKKVTENNIDVIVPLSDLDLQILANAKTTFSHIGTQIIISSREVVDTCLDKLAMRNFCYTHGLPFPEAWLTRQEFPGIFPCIRKDIRGSAGSGFAAIENVLDLEQFVEGRHLLQKRIFGTEYGIDILNDLSGRFVAACVKRKLLMRAGETDCAEVVPHPRIEALAQKISNALRHIGNLDVDVMEDESGDLFCLDFNPRFGGGYPATHLAGMNFLSAILDMVSGKAPQLPRESRRIVVMKGISLHVAPAAACVPT